MPRLLQRLDWRVGRKEGWFPDTFVGTMTELLCAVENGTEPEIGGRDKLQTVALCEAVFAAAVEDIAGISLRLLHDLETHAPPKNREEEAAKARARSAERFGR